MSISAGYRDPARERAALAIAEAVWKSPQMKQIQSIGAQMVGGQTHKIFSQATIARLAHIAPVPELSSLAHGLIPTMAELAPPIQLPDVYSGLVDFDRISAVFKEIIHRRRTEAAWWLPDDVDPARPAWVTGLHDQLADASTGLVEIDTRRALLHHTHRRCTGPPGRLLTTRGHLTRGPNTHGLTSRPCRSVGLVRA